MTNRVSVQEQAAPLRTAHGSGRALNLSSCRNRG
eukprot:CAMPEP_0173201794 /NCGR_PEP_ID=MMETSP1141-20130122/18559_1 /TAXON_ID=483371 /ORGANISM="non described non described, Strain CCMP2298" /LENGTH=33 /DNA_ID= /DNA_START= /DNA_END= /DNA_ORIENTATION=